VLRVAQIPSTLKDFKRGRRPLNNVSYLALMRANGPGILNEAQSTDVDTRKYTTTRIHWRLELLMQSISVCGNDAASATMHRSPTGAAAARSRRASNANRRSTNVLLSKPAVANAFITGARENSLFASNFTAPAVKTIAPRQ
jgi:hypothetical protein